MAEELSFLAACKWTHNLGASVNSLFKLHQFAEELLLVFSMCWELRVMVCGLHFSASNGLRYLENRIRFIDLEHEQFGICFALFCRSTSALITEEVWRMSSKKKTFFNRVGNRLLTVNLEATLFKGKGIHVLCKFDL